MEHLFFIFYKGFFFVFVKSGARLSVSMLQSRLVDKTYMYVAPKIFGGDGLSSFAPLGVNVPDKAFGLRFEPPCFLGDDILLEAYVL